MKLLVIITPFLIALFFITFSRSEKYYQKTVESYGEAYARLFFRMMGLCGYVLLIGSAALCLFFIFS